MSCARWVLVCFLCHDTDHSSVSSVSRREDCVLSNETLCDTDKTAPPSVSWRAGRRKAHCRIQSPPNVQPPEFSDSECLFTYGLQSGGYEKRKRTNYRFQQFVRLISPKQRNDEPVAGFPTMISSLPSLPLLDKRIQFVLSVLAGKTGLSQN